MKMEKNWILQTAETARLQLMATTSTNVLCSWGIETFFATTYNGMAALVIKVKARLFQGNVVICYNESDYYEVYLLDCGGAKCIGEEVYCDMLGDLIDRHIERGDDIEEYHRFCEQERQKLFRAVIG